MKDLLPDDLYDNPCIEKYKTLWENRGEDLTVSDEQIDKTDKLYNELMTNQ